MAAFLPVGFIKPLITLEQFWLSYSLFSFDEGFDHPSSSQEILNSFWRHINSRAELCGWTGITCLKYPHLSWSSRREVAVAFSFLVQVAVLTEKLIELVSADVASVAYQKIWKHGNRDAVWIVANGFSKLSVRDELFHCIFQFLDCLVRYFLLFFHYRYCGFQKKFLNL